VAEETLRDLALQWFGTDQLEVITRMLKASADACRLGEPRPQAWHCLSPDIPSRILTRPSPKHLPLWALPYLRAGERLVLARLSGTSWDVIRNSTPRPTTQADRNGLGRTAWQTSLLCAYPPQLFLHTGTPVAPAPTGSKRTNRLSTVRHPAHPVDTHLGPQVSPSPEGTMGRGMSPPYRMGLLLGQPFLLGLWGRSLGHSPQPAPRRLGSPGAVGNPNNPMDTGPDYSPGY
jgi:hypothetical protein